MRRFELVRTEDVSGVSGTGAVAEGVVFSDGTVVLRWRGEFASTIVHRDLEALLAVHGHQGRTQVHWLDQEPA